MSYQCTCRTFTDKDEFVIHVLFFVSNELEHAGASDDAKKILSNALAELTKEIK